jgi:hypothetical protein
MWGGGGEEENIFCKIEKNIRPESKTSSYNIYKVLVYTQHCN